MDSQYKPMTNFFRELGVEDVPHTNKTYLAHAIGVYNDLKQWDAGDDLCRAGMYHSIYGTERFQKVALPLERRGDVRALIGARAEVLAYWNCAMDRPSFDQAVAQDHGPYFMFDRITGQRVDLSEQDLFDLMTVHLCDWLEQVPRMKNWDYRRASYRRMAERLGGVALASYDRVFAQETAPVAH